jgi:Fur family ferric uptake transcriptional regulator
LQVFQVLPQGNHLSAADLHAVLKQQGERMSLSTIYRTLHLMAQMGLLRELELAEGHKHYELNLASSHPHHHHLVCVQCNQTIEFYNEQILKIGEKQTETNGYHLLDCQLILHVVCPEALRRGWRGPLPKDWRCGRFRDDIE